MKTEAIEIVGLGCGPQLSTCRITVVDLVRYFRKGQSYDEICGWIPNLSDAELALAEPYYRDHQAEMDERDCRANERRTEQIRLQPMKFPETNETPEQIKARLRGVLEKRRAEKNGEGHSG